MSPARRKRYVAYYRVSTDRQGKSGLGLEAQQTTVRDYINGAAEIVAEFVEIETRKRAPIGPTWRKRLRLAAGTRQRWLSRNLTGSRGTSNSCLPC
jgi:DNA invertase Pin-like site-specific DNA recombinase